MEAAAQDGADLLLLAKELNGLLGTSGQAIVYKLSQAQCRCNYLPADRSSIHPNLSPKWAPVLACLVTPPVLNCFNVARGQKQPLCQLGQAAPSHLCMSQQPPTVCIAFGDLGSACPFTAWDQGPAYSNYAYCLSSNVACITVWGKMGMFCSSFCSKQRNVDRQYFHTVIYDCSSHWQPLQLNEAKQGNLEDEHPGKPNSDAFEHDSGSNKFLVTSGTKQKGR